VISGRPPSNIVGAQRWLAVEAEKGSPDLIAALVKDLGDPRHPVLVQRRPAVDAEVGALDLVAPLVVDCRVLVIAPLAKGGSAIAAQVRPFNRIAVVVKRLGEHTNPVRTSGGPSVTAKVGTAGAVPPVIVGEDLPGRFVSAQGRLIVAVKPGLFEEISL